MDNPDRLIRIAENSFPLIAKLASSHTDAQLAVSNAFEVIPLLPFSPYKSKYFAVIEQNGQERLDFPQEGQDLIEKVIGVRDPRDYRSENSPLVGCFAMVNLGEGSAVKVLWDWHLEIAKMIYPRLEIG